MKKPLMLSLALLASLPQISLAQNYKLEKSSDLLGSCGYIHSDKHSFNDALTLIQEQLTKKLEGDNACAAPLAQLNAQLIELDTYFNRKITDSEKVKLSQEANRDYLVDLESELMMLNPADPNQTSKIASLEALISSTKQSAVTLGVQSKIAALEDTSNKEIAMAQKWESVYANSAAALTTLNSIPPMCIDRLGGWKNMIPVVMKLASAAGPLVGGAAGGIISAGFEAGGQVATLLRNNRLKGAISGTLRVQNAQIIACTYSVVQSTACELKRAKDLMDDKKKVTELINQRVANTKNAEYESYSLQIARLDRIKNLFVDIGSMGSALTLDLDLLEMYFAAVRLDPNNIKDIPPETADDDVITQFLIRMKARGATWPSRNINGGMLTPKEQYTQVMNILNSAKAIITTAQAVMTKNQSFYDLQREMINKNQYVIKEIMGLKNFIKKYLDSENIPPQYRADFATNARMLEKIDNFLSYNYVGKDDEYLKFLEDINVKGRELFEEMSRGSVAQITIQTVLMIPDIAFKRFNRPFKNIETLFLNNDIVRKDDPTYASYTDFVINRSMQSKFNTYPDLNGSKEAFRLETYTRAREGLEKGFKKEILRMVKDAIVKRQL